MFSVRRPRKVLTSLVVVALVTLALVWAWKHDALKDISQHFSKRTDSGVVQPTPAASGPVPSAPAVGAGSESSQPSSSTPQAATPAETTAQPTIPDWHEAEKGETLGSIGKRFGRNWRELCARNNLDNCNDIKVGQRIYLDITDEARAKAKSIVAIPVARAEAEPSEPGVFYWRKVGGAPLLGCGGKDEETINKEAWDKLGLTDEEKSELRAKIAAKDWKETEFKPGMRLRAVAFCGKGGQVTFKRNVVMAWKEGGNPVWARTFVLSTGRNLPWFRNCSNWGEDEPIPPAEPPVEVPPTPEEPPAPVEPPAAPPPPPPVVKEEERCPIDPKLVVGGEYEPERHGNDARAHFISAGIYCKRRGEGGTHGFGAGLQASVWSGHVNNGAGKFKGNLVGVGPGYVWEDDDHWDFEGKLLIGRLKESFKQDKYESHGRLGVAGPSVSLNHYARRKAGKRLLPETKLYGSVLFPFSREVGHSWDGQPIADTSELSGFKYTLQAGIHQDIYDFDAFTLWARVGYFLQKPSESLSVRPFGISDPNRICGIGFGKDFDLVRGGSVKAWGWHCDLVTGTQVVRKKHRQNQIERELGESGFHLESGLQLE